MMRKALAVTIGTALVVSLAIAGFTLWGLQPHQQSDHGEFCFSEWCIAPVAISAARTSTAVRVVVRSDARAASQRPDHPQAWLNGAGGPQSDLDRQVGPGELFTVDLTFQVTTSGCAAFVVGEGAWPASLGLGYAPSPFGERAGWNLCPSP